MQDVDLARVADELYALSPGDFREARDRRAAEIRASGDRDLARAVAALRRPVVSAWLVNLLVREAGDKLDELLALGESLRAAQRDLAGDLLRELSSQRRQAVTALVGEAKRLAARDGRPAGPGVEREVEATLQAALADADAAAAVSSGCLTNPLSYAGLGMGEAASAVAVPGTRRRARDAGATALGRPWEEGAAPAGAAPAGTVPEDAAAAGREGAAKRRPRETPEERAARLAAAAAEREARQAAAAAERRAAQVAAAEYDVQQATAAVAETRAALGEAERQAAAARAAQETIRRQVERLDRELSEAIAEESRANRAVRDAQRAKDAAARAVTTADQRLARAQAAARKLE